MRLALALVVAAASLATCDMGLDDALDPFGSGPDPVVARATIETDPVPSGGDAADDPAIWIHPRRPGRSVVIGTDKAGGLAVYDLDGSELQYDGSVTPNNVDVRYGFPLGGRRVALIGFGDVDEEAIGVATIDPATRVVRDVAVAPIETGVLPVGFCLYRSASSGEYYAFVVDDEDGAIEQWRLFDDGTGRVDGERVRRLGTGSNSEGCVADDRYGWLYVSEQSVGVWRFPAEPDDTTAPELVDAVEDGRLTEDVEGLAIYQARRGGGYLLVSSQGSNTFAVYLRRTGAYVGSLRIGAGAVDDVGNTDGIDVTNARLGQAFPRGLFVVQDGENPGGNQNFKLVPWQRVARAFSPPLLVDTTVDPTD